MPSKPTPAQLKTAEQLGIDSEGLSRGELYQSISHVINQNKEVRAGTSEARRQKESRRLTDVIRDADVRKSDIVRYRDTAYVLHSMDLNRVSLIPPNGGTWKVVRPIDYMSRRPRCVLKRMYRPPATHLHRLLAVSTILHARMLSDFGDTTPFEAFLESNLEPTERIRNTFGEFWAKEGVERCLDAFLQGDSGEAPTKTVSVKKTFCTNCGVRTYRRRGGSASLLRCKKCEGIPLGDVRHCHRCGIRFTKIPGLPGSKSVLCDSHRQT